MHIAWKCIFYYTLCQTFLTLESPISEKSDHRYVYLHKGYIPCTSTTRISTMASSFYWLRHGINVKMHNIPKTTKRSLLLLLIIGCVETNPGPRKIKYPCGICSKAVIWGQVALACDNCDQWYHTECTGCHLPGMKHWHNQMSPGFAQTVIRRIIQLLYMNQQCQCLIPSNVYQT